jgi:parallel beta-helix repeat protein
MKTYAVSGTPYSYELKANETIAPTTLSYSGKTINLTLTGESAERVISLSANGSMFTIASGVTLTLGNNVTLQGRSSNDAALVRINSGGTLVMETGSIIRGNTLTGTEMGSGVVVFGTFTMNGGTISGNTASGNSGGGVHVYETFTMNGGTISGNTAISGGGVSAFGTFTMNGGTISSNTASSSGGGMESSGNFIMNSGEISGNTVTNTSSSSGSSSSASGGGVYFYGNSFVMNGGKISNNKVTSTYGDALGGGVLFNNDGPFTMTNGEISNNSATTSVTGSSSIYSAGGGVYQNYGTFTMSGGIISGNTASRGGGVFTGRTFRITNGTIYGSNEATTSLRNTASSGGAALYLGSYGTTQRGTLNGSTWTSLGNLSTTNNTIKVVNGVLQ